MTNKLQFAKSRQMILNRTIWGDGFRFSFKDGYYSVNDIPVEIKYNMIFMDGCKGYFLDGMMIQWENGDIWEKIT